MGVSGGRSTVRFEDLAADPKHPLRRNGHAAQPLGAEAGVSVASTAALIFDTSARLVYVSPAFGRLVGLEPRSLIGSAPPFPWCRGLGSSGCRDRVRLLAGREARKLGIESLSWSLSRQCGGCLGAALGTEKCDQAFENELRDALCVVVSDATTVKKIQAMLPLEGAGPRDALEAALQRIAMEVEQLGLPLKLPVRLQEPDNEDLRLLSPRELEVLQPFMEGRRVAKIARRLSISPHTVRNHLQSIYRKLGVRSQAELIEKLRPEIPPRYLPEMPQLGDPGL